MRDGQVRAEPNALAPVGISVAKVWLALISKTGIARCSDAGIRNLRHRPRSVATSTGHWWAFESHSWTLRSEAG
jgi:hypothetical protein